jgi:glutamine synthetase
VARSAESRATIEAARRGIPFHELEADSVISDALGDLVFRHDVEAKRAEWDEYRTQVSDWEVDRYLDQF